MQLCLRQIDFWFSMCFLSQFALLQVLKCWSNEVFALDSKVKVGSNQRSIKYKLNRSRSRRWIRCWHGKVQSCNGSLRKVRERRQSWIDLGRNWSLRKHVLLHFGHRMPNPRRLWSDGLERWRRVDPRGAHGKQPWSRWYRPPKWRKQHDLHITSCAWIFIVCATMTINYFAAFNLRRQLKGDKAGLSPHHLIAAAQSFCRDFKGLISTWIKLPAAFDSSYFSP